jgi:putative endonuclease
MNLSSSKKGHEGEDLACDYLLKKGLDIINRNYHYGKTGEIDIVAKDGDIIVFIEVKYRKNLEYGEPEYGITKNKMKQLRKLAEAYLFDKNITDTDCRFDVVAILELEKGKPKVNYYQNAF